MEEHEYNEVLQDMQDVARRAGAGRGMEAVQRALPEGASFAGFAQDLMPPDIQALIVEFMNASVIIRTREQLMDMMRLFRADRRAAEIKYGPFHKWWYLQDRPVMKSLKDLIETIRNYNPEEDFPIEFIDTSSLTHLIGLFESDRVRLPDGTDLSHWDVSNVGSMNRTFFKSTSQYIISNWDTGNVNIMSSMFAESAFTGDISKWDMKNVNYATSMFERSRFNGDISQWQFTRIKDMESMFFDSRFNGDISKWNVCTATHVDYMFANSAFVGDTSGWDMSSCRRTSYLTMYTNSNVPRAHMACPPGMYFTTSHLLTTAINLYYTDKAEAQLRYGLFKNWECQDNYRRNINSRDELVENIRTYNRETDQPVEFWNIEIVEDLSELFANDEISLPDGTDLSHWEIGYCENLTGMFRNSHANYIIKHWKISHDYNQNLTEMFMGSSFSGDLSLWDMSNVSLTTRMFYRSTYTGDLSKWEYSQLRDDTDMFTDCPIPEKNKPMRQRR